MHPRNYCCFIWKFRTEISKSTKLNAQHLILTHGRKGERKSIWKQAFKIIKFYINTGVNRTFATFYIILLKMCCLKCTAKTIFQTEQKMDYQPIKQHFVSCSIGKQQIKFDGSIDHTSIFNNTNLND